jgi:hypothetical protein
MSFLKVFKKPHHSSTLSLRGVIHSVIATAVVISLAFLFKPYGLKNLESSELLNTVVTLGGITFIMMLLAQFIFPFIIKDFYSEEKWTTGKQFVQLLIMSFLICFATVFYLSSKSLASFPIDALTIFAFSILPLGVLALTQQNLLRGKFDKLAEEKNQDLKRKGVVNSVNPLNVLAFRGEGQKLNLIPNQLIYIKTEGNRAEFYYQNMLGVEKTGFAISRASILEELKGHPQFESFGSDIILNVNAIQEITGSARGYDIQIARVNALVKVSHKDRKKIDNL